MSDFLDAVAFNEKGLVCVTAVDDAQGDILMQAWMNREALAETVATGQVVYFSRSRHKLWRKGEQSGNTQLLKSLWLDCDGDALIVRVEQRGGIACHTGRRSCFYRRLTNHKEWQIELSVLKSSEEMYGK